MTKASYLGVPYTYLVGLLLRKRPYRVTIFVPAIVLPNYIHIMGGVCVAMNTFVHIAHIKGEIVIFEALASHV